MTNLLSKIGELIGNVFGQQSPGTSPFQPGTGPSRLLIMRHGEKTGDKSDPHLSPAGARRAEALAAYLPQQPGKLDFLIAAANTDRSRRPRETLEPLGNVLGLGIFDTFGEKEIGALIEHLSTQTYSGKHGVIAWRHSDIPPLVAALGGADGSYPKPWEDDVFNLIIEMTFAGAAAPSVRQIVEPF